MKIRILIIITRPPDQNTFMKYFKSSSNEVNDSHNNNQSVSLNTVNNKVDISVYIDRN